MFDVQEKLLTAFLVAGIATMIIAGTAASFLIIKLVVTVL